MEQTPLSELEPGKKGYKIKCRVARIWNSTNPMLEDQIISLDLLLVDDKGTAIQATIRKEDSPRMRELFVEGRVYTLANFYVGLPKKSFRVCNHESMLRIGTWTIIKEEKNAGQNFPIDVFNIFDLNMLEVRLYKDILLTDVVGNLKSVGAIEDKYINGRMIKTQEVIIQSLSLEKIQITLWGVVAEKFNEMEDYISETEEPIVAVFAAMTVRSFQAKTTLSSTSATKIYLDLDIEEVRDFRKRMQYAEKVSILKTAEQEINKKNVDEVIEEKTIAELFNQHNWHSKQNSKSVCRAVVTDIDVSRGWWYNACPKCRTGVGNEHLNQICNKCGPLENMAIPWYKLNLAVADQTGNANFLIFGKHVERLVKQSAHTLSKLPGSDKNVVPPVMKEIRGKTYKFIISSGSRDDDLKTYTFKVSQVIEDGEETTENKDKGKRKMEESFVCEPTKNDTALKGKTLNIEQLSSDDDLPLSKITCKKMRIARGVSRKSKKQKTEGKKYSNNIENE